MSCKIKPEMIRTNYYLACACTFTGIGTNMKISICYACCRIPWRCDSCRKDKHQVYIDFTNRKTLCDDCADVDLSDIDIYSCWFDDRSRILLEYFKYSVMIKDGHPGVFGYTKIVDEVFDIRKL